MLFSCYRIYVCCLIILLLYNNYIESFKIRYGREKSRIDKLKRKKGAILDKLNDYIKTRGYGLLPLKASSIDTKSQLNKEPEPDTVSSTTSGSGKYTLTTRIIKRRKTKNPLIPINFDKFDPLFRKISPLRTYKRKIDFEDRPGKIDPDTYRKDFVEGDNWDIHPSKIRVRGKYFSKLYEYELKEPWKRHQFDTGSTEVVVAALTAKIDYLTYHLENNRKDVRAKRKITKLGHQRRKLLCYLYRTKRETYDLLTNTFDIHFEQDFSPFHRIIKKNTHLYHPKTKRYHTAKERKKDLLNKAMGKKH